MSALRRIVPFAVLGCAFALPTSSCLDATEIDLRITTDVAASAFMNSDARATILIGSPSDAGFTATSVIPTNPPDGGDYGDLIVVPNGSLSATVEIVVVLGVTQSTESCFDPKVSDRKGCIVATREIEYSRHQELVLPIVLESKCLNVTCDEGSTCENGQCVSAHPACDGGTCNPQPDSSFLDVISVLDGCAGKTTCNGECVDLGTSPTNCGACGLDCSAGSCQGGTCALATQLQAACVAVTTSSVYVVTTTGELVTLPKKGGLPTSLPTNGTAVDLKAIATNAAYSVLANPWSVNVTLPPQKYSLANQGVAQVVAVDPIGIGWLDLTQGEVWFQAFNSGTATKPWGQISATSVASLTAANGILYATFGNEALCRFDSAASACLTQTSSVAVTQPGYVTVSDASSANPDLYVVEGGASVVKLSSTLSTVAPYAAGTTALGAIAYHVGTTTLVGATPNGVVTSQGGPFAPLTVLPGSETRCVAVDDTAVYWIANHALLKHAY